MGSALYLEEPEKASKNPLVKLLGSTQAHYSAFLSGPALYSAPDTDVVYLKKRKGFVKVAIQNG